MSNKTNFVGFIKTAASTVGPSVMSVPAKMASDAYELYISIPEENGVKIAYSMYREVKPGFNKIAMEMVAANILADLDTQESVKVSSNAATIPEEEAEPRALSLLKKSLNDYNIATSDLKATCLPNNLYRQGFNNI